MVSYCFGSSLNLILIITQPAWDVFEKFQSDLHWERHLSETSQKRRLFCDVFKTSQIHLRKDVFLVISFRHLKYISKKMLFYVKIDVRTLKTLKKWNVVFWEQCIANNQSVMSISGLMIACSLLHLAVLLC